MSDTITLNEFVSGEKAKAQEVNDNFTALKEAVLTKVDESDTTVTKLGNTFNAANLLVQLDENAKLPAVDGSNLTGMNLNSQIINFGDVASGTVTLTEDRPHIVSFSGDSTITIPSSLTSGVLYNCSVLVTITSGTTVTLPSVTWAYGVEPSLTSTSVKYRLTFETWDGGSTWFGFYTQIGA